MGGLLQPTSEPGIPPKLACMSPRPSQNAQLRQAQQILQGLSARMSGKHPAAGHVDAAIGEINTALSIR